MRAFIVAIIVFGLTLGISVLVLFRYGMSDNQSTPSKHSSRYNVQDRNADRIRYRRIALAVAAAARMVMKSTVSGWVIPSKAETRDLCPVSLAFG
jgi:hypothetical protein